MNDFTNRNKFGNPNDEFLFGTGLFGLAGVYCITIKGPHWSFETSPYGPISIGPYNM